MSQLQNIDTSAAKSKADKLPAQLSLTSTSQKNVESQSEDISLLGNMQGLIQMTEVASTPTQTTAATSSNETDEETADETENYDDSDLWLMDFNTNQPSSGGIIGGSVVGLASKYLLDEQSSLLNMSINWLLWSAKNNEQQGVYAQNQRNSARDAANKNFDAGMMQVAAGFAGAGCAGVAAAGGLSVAGKGSGMRPTRGTSASEQGLASKEAQMNDCDSRIALVNKAGPAKGGSATAGGTPAENMTQAKKNVVKEAFKDGDGVPKDRHFKAQAKEAYDKELADAKKKQDLCIKDLATKKAAHEGDQSDTTKQQEYDDALTKKSAADVKVKELEDKSDTLKAEYEKKLRDEVGTLRNEDGSLNVKEKSKEIGDNLELNDTEKGEIQEKTEKHKERLSNEFSSLQHKLSSDMQYQNLIWKEAIGGILQSGFTLQKTIDEKKGAFASADAQMNATVSGQLANLVGSASGMASQMYQQAMSTMQGTMQALQRAANPA